METAHPSSPVIALRLRTINQIFHSLDPAPFRERDLDDDAARYIFEEAQDRPRDVPLSLDVRVPESELPVASHVPEAVHTYFRLVRESKQRELREVRRFGRYALVAGLLFVVVAAGAIQGLRELLRESPTALGLVESLSIVAWVALWRPVELLLFDWWPISRQLALLRRLEAMPITVSPA